MRSARLSALGDWYLEYANEIFDDRDGAERHGSEDVSRYFARELARRGPVGNVFRVVPLIDATRRAHVAEYPGEGDVDED